MPRAIFRFANALPSFFENTPDRAGSAPSIILNELVHGGTAEIYERPRAAAPPPRKIELLGRLLEHPPANFHTLQYEPIAVNSRACAASLQHPRLELHHRAVLDGVMQFDGM